MFFLLEANHYKIKTPPGGSPGGIQAMSKSLPGLPLREYFLLGLLDLV
jgi:hypothetical protein